MRAAITGDQAALRQLHELRARAADARPAWPAVGGVVAGEVREQFASGGARFGRGQRWSPLDPAYLRRKRAAGFSGGILVRTGALRDSLTSRPMSIERYTPDSARFGTSDPKAHFAQGVRRRGRARPVLDVTREMRRRINKKLSNYLTDGRTG